MFKLIKELFQLLTPSQRKRFYTLQILVIIMALAEIVGIASIAPFMALVGDVSMLGRENILASLYKQSGIQNPYDFVFLVGVAVLAALTMAAVVSMYTIWKLSMFAAKVGTEIADRLYTYYMNQSWLFHSTGSSAQLTKQVSNEAVRVTDGVIQPLMQMNARVVLAIFLSIGIFAYNPIVAITGLAIFAVAYILLYKLVRKRLQENGQTLSSVATQRFRLMNEGFGGIKDVLLLNRNQDFISRFEQTGNDFAYARGNNNVLWQVPRYFMELLAFGSMVGLVLYLIVYHQGNLGAVLPILAVYALAGFKLLPAFQQIYASIGQIKGNIAAFEAVREDLLDSQKCVKQSSKQITVQSKQQNNAHLTLKQTIQLKQVTFSYPNKLQPALNNFNITIPANSVIGIVGPSGSGKSTAIDILLGLIAPQKGQLIIDNTPITEQNIRAWQSSIGFVPQSIFLSEGSIAENVAFGIPEKDIKLDQVHKALSLAHLDELVHSLDQGIHTKVGERGVQLSGGQRQRIGIARALYEEADVLIFDEATSALDGITEKMVMDAIHDFSGQKTIIMIAHRLKTVQKCDIIFMINEGQVTAQGTFEELLKTNEYFKRMANNA
ncbi:ABC transporter ATP-binding protein [Vibrio cholerae]|uniref:ABC transporter ATP-binding protein n=1 Tax=Vibrio cholerae TaxID=666 RepID=UPI0000F1B7CE|nr:ABC transporter ATP-binding protein [Vibrio cholerae]EGQ8141745.1 ABC transporter ATP-binding protein [Vibrio cholerae]EGQ9900081.1 ABC transporter ATP-binding protein [Vibrio cholerae]EGR0075302.1 ABC transporter ATP-binding protein [Vibrio cholerae]EGR0566583.1 ABC transporter ATP-binding protein [Vibrio cholerae]EGR2589415.1 ABC transporter ATP-binding protein [Vibrio cholerae]